MTDERTTVVEAWSAIMEDARSVGKTGRNKAQGYDFRGIDAVVNAVGPLLRKHHVIVTPHLQTIEYSSVEIGEKRTHMGHVKVRVHYIARGMNGDELLIGDVPGEAMDVGDKAAAKAMSVAYRICLLQSLTLPTSEPDADEFSYERAADRNTRIPDIREPLWADIKTAREAKGWSSDDVIADFALWSHTDETPDGKRLIDATADELQAYLLTLTTPPEVKP